MDELIQALGEMINVIDYYIREMSENVSELGRIVSETTDSLGNDTLGIRTVEMLENPKIKMENSVDYIAGIKNKIQYKLDQLIEVRMQYENESK